MTKSKLFAVAFAAVLVSCSSDSLVKDSGENKTKETPIGFTVQKQNITRAANTNLEAVKHYNFGVWAWKVGGKNSLADQEVMNNYLVGWSNNSNLGYDPTNATTYATSTSSTSDHVSPWFYEGLGTAEYTNPSTGYYQTAQTNYMSNNANQYLRYWDLAYAKTNFYCYAPYKKNGTEDKDKVTFTKDATTSTMTFGASVIRDGYDEPQNSAYNDYSRTLGEYMYAGVQATNSSLADVTIPFKHMGAQLFIRFYEDIPGYKVEIIELNGDNGTMKSGLSGNILGGIQATPAKETTKPVYYTATDAEVTSGTKKAGDIKTAGVYEAGSYYVTQGAKVSFTEATAAASYDAVWIGSETKNNTVPLMFKIPQAGLSTASDAPANLDDYTGLNSTTHKIIKEKSTTDPQEYSYSPTIYYPVAQPTTSTTGFTFHVSYRVIAEDNKEVTTVHNATVFVPANDGATTPVCITAWQPNVKYTYTFKITRGSTGTTNPETAIDPTDPTPATKTSLYPIVFDAATIEDYTENVSEYEISNGTTY